MPPSLTLLFKYWFNDCFTCLCLCLDVLFFPLFLWYYTILVIIWVYSWYHHRRPSQGYSSYQLNEDIWTSPLPRHLPLSHHTTSISFKVSSRKRIFLWSQESSYSHHSSSSSSSSSSSLSASPSISPSDYPSASFLHIYTYFQTITSPFDCPPCVRRLYFLLAVVIGYTWLSCRPFVSFSSSSHLPANPRTLTCFIFRASSLHTASWLPSNLRTAITALTTICIYFLAEFEHTYSYLQSWRDILNHLSTFTTSPHQLWGQNPHIRKRTRWVY